MKAKWKCFPCFAKHGAAALLPCTWEAETGESGVQGQPQLQSQSVSNTRTHIHNQQKQTILYPSDVCELLGKILAALCNSELYYKAKRITASAWPGQGRWPGKAFPEEETFQQNTAGVSKKRRGRTEGRNPLAQQIPVCEPRGWEKENMRK